MDPILAEMSTPDLIRLICYDSENGTGWRSVSV
jgi:hypothetical protein